jgi:hypothetical protein
MTPSERRAACLKLLAKLDQEIAECEALWQEILADDEREVVAVNWQFRLTSRKRVERLLAGINPIS